MVQQISNKFWPFSFNAINLPFMSFHVLMSASIYEFKFAKRLINLVGAILQEVLFTPKSLQPCASTQKDNYTQLTFKRQHFQASVRGEQM